MKQKITSSFFRGSRILLGLFLILGVGQPATFAMDDVLLLMDAANEKAAVGTETQASASATEQKKTAVQQKRNKDDWDMDTFLEKQKARAEKNGTEFDEAATRARFVKKDINGDGILTKEERAAPPAKKKAKSEPTVQNVADDIRSQLTDDGSTEDPAEKEIYEALAADVDDTIAMPSVNVDQTYVNKKDATRKDGQTTLTDPWKYQMKFAGEYTWGGARKNDWAIRVNIPYVYNDPGNWVHKSNGEPYRTDEIQHGWGDLGVKLKRVIPLRSKATRANAAFKVSFPTAQHDDLGNNAYGFEPEINFSRPLISRIRGTLNLKYIRTFDEDGWDTKNSKFNFKPGVIFALPYQAVLSLNYTGQFDLNNDFDYYHTGKIKLNKRIGKLNAGIGYLQPLTSDSNVNYQIDLTMSYNF